MISSIEFLRNIQTCEKQETVHAKILSSCYTEEQKLELFKTFYEVKKGFHDDFYFSVARKSYYEILKWMEKIDPKEFPGYVVNIIEDIDVIKYFLDLGYTPNEWALPNAFEFDNLEERVELFLNYDEALDDEAFQWLAIDDFRQRHIPIINKMIERKPDWLNTEHGWVYTYRVMQPEPNSVEHMNKILMTSWEQYEPYESDDEDDIENDNDYQEIEELLETNKPNANTIYICGKNSSLSYMIIKKVFEKSDFCNVSMMAALSQFEKDIKESNSVSTLGVKKLLKIARERKSKVFRKLEYPSCSKNKKQKTN